MRLSNCCYAVTGLGYAPPWVVNAGLAVGTKTTLAIDTGPTTFAAATIHGYGAAVRAENDWLVVNTERHLDHIGGNCFFHDRGIPILGHAGIDRTDDQLAADLAEINALVPERVRRERREAAVPYQGTRIVNPTRPFDRDLTLDLGGLAVDVLLTPGHTPTNACVFVAADGVLFTGDSVVAGYLPNLEAGGPEDWRRWLASLDRIESLAPRVIVPGHGPVLRDRDVPQAIDEVRRVLRDAIACGRAPTAAQP